MSVREDYIDFSDIVVGPYAKNSFAGMKIYSASLRTSPGSPAKLTIRCVEDAQRTGGCNPLQEGDPIIPSDSWPAFLDEGGPLEQEFAAGINITENSYSIKIADILLPEMYLISYDKSTTTSSRVLTLEFVDKSILLDKIFIGLINFHAADNRPLPQLDADLPGDAFGISISQMQGGQSWAPTKPGGQISQDDLKAVSAALENAEYLSDPRFKPIHIDADGHMPIYKPDGEGGWYISGYTEEVAPDKIFWEISEKRLFSSNVSASSLGWAAALQQAQGLCPRIDSAGRVTNPLINPKAGQSIMARVCSFVTTANCEPCSEEIIAAALAGRPPDMRRVQGQVIRVIDHGRLVNVDHRYGGSIILGTETFTLKNDDLPNVEYSFVDLLTAVNESGIAVDAQAFTKVNRNRDLKRSYTGTLREVLNNWATDFAFQWDWDFTSTWNGIGIRTSGIVETNVWEISLFGNVQEKRLTGDGDKVRFILNAYSGVTLDGNALIFDGEEIDLELFGGALTEGEKKVFRGTAHLDFGAAVIKPVLTAFDLTIGGQRSENAMSEIKSLLDFPDDGMGIESINEQVTSEGTTKINFQTLYRKPAKARNYTRKIQYRKIYQALDPFDLFSEKVGNRYRDIGGGRTRDEFAISCSLAKFNRNARTLYNWYFTDMIRNRKSAALGLTILDDISGDEMEDMLDQDFSVSTWDRIFKRYGQTAFKPVGYVAIHSKEEEAKWERFEQQTADLYGKYFVHQEEDDYDNQCAALEKWERTIQHAPAGIKVKKNNFMDLPFFDMALSHPQGRQILDQVSGNFYEAGRRTINSDTNDTFMVFQRNTSWGTDQDVFNQAFVHSGIDFLENLVPTYIDLQGRTRVRFYSKIESALRDQDKTLGLKKLIDQFEGDAKIILVLAPPADFIDSNFYFTHHSSPPHFEDNPYSTDYELTLTAELGGTETHSAQVVDLSANQGGWNNANEYRVIDEDTHFIRPCKENYLERDYIKDLCKCDPYHGVVPTGSDLAYFVSEIDDEQMTDFVCPRPGWDVRWGLNDFFTPANYATIQAGDEDAGDWNFGSYIDAPGLHKSEASNVSNDYANSKMLEDNAGGTMVMPWFDWGHKYLDRMPEPVDPNDEASVMAAFPFLPGQQEGVGGGGGTTTQGVSWNRVNGPSEITNAAGVTSEVQLGLRGLAGWDGLTAPGDDDYPTPDEIRQVAEMFYRPFIKDYQQRTNEGKFGTIAWPNIGVDQNYGSRFTMHLCEGYRINTRLPGTHLEFWENSDPSNPSQGTVSMVDQLRMFSPTGSGFAGPEMNIDIIFPSQNWYAGVRNDQLSYTKYSKGAKEVRGCIADAGRSVRIEVNTIDITNDFDSMTDPDGQGEINLAVPVGLASFPGYNFSQVNLDEYHNILRQNADNLEVQLPKRTLSFRQAGTKSTFSPYLNPLDGLESFSLTLDQDGAYIDWSFATRQLKMPTPDVMTQKIGAAMNMNVIR